jgi:hypothetical protein
VNNRYQNAVNHVLDMLDTAEDEPAITKDILIANIRNGIDAHLADGD